MMQVGPFELRKYQEDVYPLARKSFRCGNRLILLVGPTGCGKTLIICGFAEQLKEGHRLMIVTSGRQLVFQASEKLTACEMPHSILMANCHKAVHRNKYCKRYNQGDQFSRHSRIIVVSKETYQARLDKGWLDEMRVDLIIEDEAHMHLSESWDCVRNCGKLVIGFTATPINGKGLPLPGWDDLITIAEYPDLIADGSLVDYEYAFPAQVLMDGVKVNRSGEYNENQAADRYLQEPVIGDAVRAIRDLTDGTGILTFAQSVGHSLKLKQEFNRAGYRFEHMDANTPQEERTRIFDAFSSGEINGITNYWVIGVGVDLPCAKVVQIQRSMKSLANFIQCAGRGIRPYPGKDKALLIDHGGNVIRHGLPVCRRLWTLEGDEKIKFIDSRGRESTDPEDFDEVKNLVSKPMDVYTEDGDLVKATPEQLAKLMGKKLPKEPKEKKKSTPASKWKGCLIHCATSKHNKTFADALELYSERTGGETIKQEQASHWFGDINEPVKRRYPFFDYGGRTR